MTDWPNVRWTQARQVALLMGVRDADAPPESVTPAAWCENLREAGRTADALTLVGLALPRFEGVVWASNMVEAMGGALDPQIMAAIKSWIADPDDKSRRAVWGLAETADDEGPERLLAYAVFLSGGSIAAEDQMAVNPQPDLSGRLAAAAVITAAYRTPDPPSALAAALKAGEAVARGET